MARPTGPGGRKVLHLEAEAKKDRLLELLLQGLLVTEALAEIGVSEGAYRQWRKRDELFAAELDSILNGSRQFKEGDQDWEGFADFRLKFFGHHTPPHQMMMVQALEEAQPGDITLILVFPESGKTTLFEDYACYKLATDPTWRSTIGTEAQGLARRIVGRIKNRLEVDGPFPQFVSAFGPFAPQRNDGRATQQVWAQDYFNVYKRKGSDQRDFNVVGIGFGSQIAGTRTDHLHCDDLQSMKSLNQTPKMFETFQQDWLSRPGEHGKTTINGTRVGDGDIYEAIEEAYSGKSFFRVVRLPAVIVDHATGEKRPLWEYDPKTKSGYTMKQLDRMREKVGESAWARNYMQQPRSKSLGTWTEDIVDRCLNTERIYGQDTLPVPGAPVYIGLDPALGGINCLMAIQVTGTKLYILDIQEDEKLARNEDIMLRLEAMIVNVKARGGHVTDVIIEAMNFQRGLARDERLKELAERHAFSAREHLTNSNKYDADIGVPSMVSSFIRREIDIPNGDDDRTREVTSQLRNQLLRWRPGARGSVLRQDQVMALWFVWVVWQSRRKVVDEARTNFVSDALPWKPTTSGLLVPAGGASPFYKR